MSSAALIKAIAPTTDFRSVCDTSRTTKAVYIASDANATFVAVNGVTSPETIPVGGQVYPIGVSTDITIATYTTIYLY